MSIIQDVYPTCVAAGLYRLLLPACIALALVAAIIALWLVTPDRAPCTSVVTGPQALPWLNDARTGDLAGCRQ